MEQLYRFAYACGTPWHICGLDLACASRGSMVTLPAGEGEGRPACPDNAS